MFAQVVNYILIIFMALPDMAHKVIKSFYLIL